jgi:Holliday junction resolvase RusA-like endonuclease
MVDWRDAFGQRCHRQFHSRENAESFWEHIKANPKIGQTPNHKNHDCGRRLLSITVPWPARTPRQTRRQLIADALQKAYPNLAMSLDPIIVHMTAMLPPAHTQHDVDNLLKPVLDAMAGIVYVNDTQVVEYLVRKVPGVDRKLLIEVWALALFRLRY